MTTAIVTYEVCGQKRSVEFEPAYTSQGLSLENAAAFFLAEQLPEATEDGEVVIISVEWKK